MTFGLRAIARMLLILTSFGVYGTLGALHAPGGVLTSIVLVALMTFVAILAHELAHAGAAHMVGARIHAIVALPFRLRLHPRRLDLIKRGGHGDLGGYVSYSLDTIDARRKRAIIAAAGPLANLALALMAGMMAPMFDKPTLEEAMAGVPAHPVPSAADRGLPGDPAMPPPSMMAITIPKVETPVWAIILTAFALLSGGLGLANLIPYGGSDGDHILNLWRHGARGRS